MRLALAILALACASSATAEPVQDRYGPPRKAVAPQAVAPQTAAPMAARLYEGRLLGWSGKAAAPAPQPAAVQVATRPEPQPPARRAAAPPPPAPPPVAAAQPPAARAQPMSSWSQAPLPQSLYDAPTAHAPAAPPPPAPRLAEAPPPPAPQRGAAPSRLYSLHREYGMAPDTVPATSSQTNYVLIGPPDAPAEAEDESDEAPARKPSVDARLF